MPNEKYLAPLFDGYIQSETNSDAIGRNPAPYPNNPKYTLEKEMVIKTTAHVGKGDSNPIKYIPSF